MPATPSEILRIWFERVWNQGDESTIDELYGPTAVANGLPAAPIPGPEGFKPFFRAFRAAFPDIRVEVTARDLARATSAWCTAASPAPTPAS